MTTTTEQFPRGHYLATIFRVDADHTSGACKCGLRVLVEVPATPEGDRAVLETLMWKHGAAAAIR